MARMTEKRLELHEILCDVLGSRNVYFQPPESVKMKYPAIVYHLNNIENDHADNGVYGQSLSYSIIVVDKDPDSEISEKISKLPRTRFERSFIVDNLNHFVFVKYF